MCRVNLHHSFRHHITSASFFRRLGILNIDNYFHNRILRWAGHVARIPVSRAPRQLLTGWVSHSRPIDCPQMTWGRTLENALKSKGISKDSDEWIAVAKDSRSKWRQLTHSNPKPPDACWLKDISRALHKRTLSPVRLVLKVTHFSVAICHSGVSLYIWGVLTRLDLTRQRAHEPMGH